MPISTLTLWFVADVLHVSAAIASGLLISNIVFLCVAVPQRR